MPFINRCRISLMRLFLLLIVTLLPGVALAQSGALSGNLSSVGSDTLGYLMTLWGEDFSRQAPGRQCAGTGIRLFDRAHGAGGGCRAARPDEPANAGR
ncbi:hypothetical protein [Pantoea conspicua]|uniref:hypothetical protein n=1 Tax=Pantoea conspicua TaxID=472705 RepID=UPI003CC5C8DC